MYYSLISKLNFRKYTPEELAALAKDFAQQMQAKLENKPSTLMMISSHVKKLFPEKSVSEILAIDFGGSNLRMALFTFDPDKKILELKTGAKIHSLELQHDNYSLDGLMTTIADTVMNYLKEMQVTKVKNLGFTFSFPAEIIVEGRFIDASCEHMSENWGKGFFVEGSKTNISRVLREKLLASGLPVENMVTVNDATALLLSDPQAAISLTIGTGYNLGILLADKTICNSEAAFFSNQFMIDTLTPAAKLVLEEMQDEFKSIYGSLTDFVPRYSEIQISGAYLYKLLIMSLCFLGENNIELMKTISGLESSALSMILNNGFKELEAMAHTKFTMEDTKVLGQIVNDIVGRASDLVAAQIAGTIIFLQQNGLQANSYIQAADGTVIRHLPGLHKQIEQKVRDMLKELKLPGVTPENFRSEFIENSTLYGAAYGVLGN